MGQNFLINGDITPDEQKDIRNNFEKIVDVFNAFELSLYCDNLDEVEKIILDKKISKSEKAKLIKDYLEIKPKDEHMEFDSKKATKVLAVLMVGNKGNVKDICQWLSEDEFDDDAKTLLSIKFSETKYEESQRDELQEAIPEELDIIEAIKSFYDWSI